MTYTQRAEARDEARSIMEEHTYGKHYWNCRDHLLKKIAIISDYGEILYISQYTFGKVR